MTKAIFFIGIVFLVIPCASLAGGWEEEWEEEWEGNSWYPISNFSFELYDEYPDLFDDWDFNGIPIQIRQSFAHSVHYSKSANINVGIQSDTYLEQTLGQLREIVFDEQPCYLIAYVKTEEVSSTSGGGVLAKVITDSGGTQEEYESNIITGTRNWVKLIVPFDLIELGENDEVTIQIGLFSAKGKVWIDFVQLIPRDCLSEQTLNEIPHLKNISFEKYSNNVFEDWGSTIGVNCTITQSENICVLGSNSARFTFSTPPDTIRTSYLFQFINVPQDFRTYCFSAYIRTDDLDISGVPGGLGAYYQINYPNLTWGSKSFSGDNGWVRVEGVIEKPRDTGLHDPIQVKAIVSAKEGKAWFDWVNLRLNLVQNVEFNDWGITESDLVVWEEARWSGSGSVGIWMSDGHESAPCGRVQNISDSHQDAALLQILGVGEGEDEDFICLHEGGTYQLSGWIKTDEVEPLGSPMPDEPPYGAFVQLIVDLPDPEGIAEIARSECFVGTTDGWQEFSLVFSIPFDWFKRPHFDDKIYMFNNDYHLLCRLHEASGTAYFDDINITELEFTEDLATVIPQPQAIEYRGYSSAPLACFEPTNGGTYITTIYYTPENPPVSVLGDTYLFSAENLRQELNRAFYECSGTDYQYPIEADHVIPLDENVNSLSLPCIILGDPELDNSDGELFKAELEKRGIIIPEDFDPEGYIMDISENIIIIAARDSLGEGVAEGAGSYYGTQTLLQILDIAEEGGVKYSDGVQYHANTVVAPAGYCIDYPDLPWRGQLYCDIPWDSTTGDEPGEILEFKFDEDRPDGEAYFKQNKRDLAFFSALKVNRVQIETGVYYYQDGPHVNGYTAQHWNYEDYWNKMKDLFNFCRRRHMEPIPLLQSGGHTAHILYWRPWFAECMWIGGVDLRPEGAGDPYPRVREMKQFDDDGLLILDEYNVIDAPGTEIRLFYSQTGEDEIIREGNWYPTFSSEPFFRMSGGFDPLGGRVTIHISEDSELEPNDTVYVSYNCIWPAQHNKLWGLAYCTAADGLYDFMEGVIDKTIDELNPKYIHLGHDEVFQYHTDERDRAYSFEQSLLEDSGYDMPARLLATDLDELIDIVKDHPNPPKVIVYADLMNFEHRGEFFCETDLFWGARPCDMGGVDEWENGDPQGKTWPACMLLESADHGDIIMEGWTGYTYIYGYSEGEALYSNKLIYDVINWQVNSEHSQYTTLGTGYSNAVGEATATFYVKYKIGDEEYEKEVKFNPFHPLITNSYSWYKSDNDPYITPEINLTDATSVITAFVTARISGYLFGSVWFDNLSVHEEGGDNKLENPGFEVEDPAPENTFLHWTDHIHEGADHDYIIRDTDVKFGGDASCRLFRPKYPLPTYTNVFVMQDLLEDGKGLPITEQHRYVLEGYMRAENIESFIFLNCYHWTHHIYNKYSEGYDCPGVVYFGYTWVYPAIIHDWLWSIDWPVTWWENENSMAYLKIGHKGGLPGLYYQPLNDLYPIEIGKLEE